jgi:hypothetical protein
VSRAGGDTADSFAGTFFLDIRRPNITCPFDTAKGGDGGDGGEGGGTEHGL